MQNYNISINYDKLLNEEYCDNFLKSLSKELTSIINDYEPKNTKTKQILIDKITSLTTGQEITIIDIINAIIDTSLFINNTGEDFQELYNTIVNIQNKAKTEDFSTKLEQLDENVKDYNLKIKRLVTEATSITYQELRQFLSTLYKYCNNSTTKTIIIDLVTALGKMEMSGIKPKDLPQIAKLKSISPSLF